jgi:nitronate monooxygenase
VTARLSTPWSRALGLTAPIANAPMGGVAGGRLAAAVSRAGALGMVGLGSAGSAAGLRAELAHVAALGRPFGVGLVAWVVERDPELLDVALAAAPALLAVSFGDDLGWVGRAHGAGVAVAVQVADAAAARRAADAGADVVVARGAEGGGHGTPAMGTLPLLDAVLDVVEGPVLAAGGISGPRSLAAVLAAGAQGAWVGTAFAACAESTLAPGARDRMRVARGEDAVLTTTVDEALGYPWPAHQPARVLRNRLTEGAVPPDGDAVRDAFAAGDWDVATVDAGQGVGLVGEPRPAAEVVAWFCAGAAERLRTSHRLTD